MNPPLPVVIGHITLPVCSTVSHTHTHTCRYTWEGSSITVTYESRQVGIWRKSNLEWILHPVQKKALAFSEIPGYDRQTLPGSPPFHFGSFQHCDGHSCLFVCLQNNPTRQHKAQLPIIPSMSVFQVLYSTTPTVCQQFSNMKEQWAKLF